MPLKVISDFLFLIRRNAWGISNNFDTNKAGKISTEEFGALLKKEECDTLELSTIVTNKDNIITEEEFADFEQKIQIQEALNELQGTIAKDFTGANSQYASQWMAELRDFATDFVANYSGTGDMVADFKAALPAKYEEIKNNILNNTPEALAKKAENEKKEIKSRVLDNYVNEYIANAQNADSEMSADLAKSIATALGKKLETLLEKLRTTMRAKAKAMCTANGVEFDESVFKTQFNNAKSLAVGNQLNVNSERLTKLSNGKLGNVNPQEMITEFLTTFKTNYTTWVENQKTKNK